MNTNTRKSFFLVESDRVYAVSQDAEFDGNDSVLIYARNEFEAIVIAEAYGDELVGVDNVFADDGEVVAAAHAPSDDTLESWIQYYLTSDSKDVVAALTALAPKDVIEKISALKSSKKIEPTIKYYHECPWAVVKTRDGEHSLEVSLTNLHYSEDGKPYLLAYQNTEESGPQELHLYLL